jgi:hypothetical protein
MKNGVRIRALVERSHPNPERPKLRPELEEQLHELDRRSASCYAELELLSEQFSDLACEMDDDDEAAIPAEIEEEDSLAISLDEARESVQQRRLDTDVEWVGK